VFVHALPKAILGAALTLEPGQVWRCVAITVREAACAFCGHDHMVQATGNRLYLCCANCGHETPGWRVEVERNRGARHEPR
jgi:hypothetical protein